MKIVYNDRRNRLNWGARSTGKALWMLLNKEHDIFYRFDLPVNFVLSRVGLVFERLQQKSKAKLWFYSIRLLSLFFTKLPWWGPKRILTSNIDETSALILKYAQRNKYLKDLIENIKNADALVINGEGSLIIGNPTRKEVFFYFALIKIAKEFGKQTYYINAIASENTFTGKNDTDKIHFIESFVYCDKILVRDPYSLQYLINCNFPEKIKYVPDSLFTWKKYLDHGLDVPKFGDSILPFPDEITDYGKFDFNLPYLCITGSSIYITMSDGVNYDDVINRYILLVSKLKELGINIFLMESCSNDAFLYKVAKFTNTLVVPSKINLIQALSILAHARIYIGGRYHPGIMASLGGTPCIFLESNSHKTQSLQKMLDYDEVRTHSSFLPDKDIEDIFKRCKYYLENQTTIRNKIKELASLLAKEASRLTEYLV